MIEREIKETQALIEETQQSLPNAIMMGLVERNLPVYSQSVPDKEKTVRRARNKRARKARRATRQ